MKIKTVTMLSIASLALIFSVYGGAASSASGNSTAVANSISNTTSFGNTCDIKAYVIDKDPKGLNVRDSPDKSGELIGVIPFDKEGTIVHIVSDSATGGYGWVQIDKAETLLEKIVFNSNGWVSGNMLAISTRGYDTKGVKLYDGGGKKGPVLTVIPPETELKILGCDGKRVHVKYKDTYGWLEPDAQCAHPGTNCN